jgi:hypothetical protein
MTNLLAIDFDAFFPTGEGGDEPYLWDWSHIESPLYIDVIWPVRAATFLMEHGDLPDLDHDLYDGFWDSVALDDDATLYVAESNAAAASPAVAEGTRDGTVVNLDAHHDAGYDGPATTDEAFDAARRLAEAGTWACENWLVYYQLTAARTVSRYPAWRHDFAMDREPEPYLPLDRGVWRPDEWAGTTFGRVFLCRSGAWVPPWLDERLVELIDAFPGGGGVVDLDAGADHGYSALKPRGFDRDAAETMARQFAEQRGTPRPTDG